MSFLSKIKEQVRQVLGLSMNIKGSWADGYPKFTLAKIRLASHPHTKAKTLTWLAKCNCERIVIRVAENTNTPVEVLEKLANHPCVEVRVAVCENNRTGLAVLTRLVKDPDADVRYSLSENHNVPLAILEQLATDENPYVAMRAVKTIQRIKFSPAHTQPFSWLAKQNRRASGN